jgi:hypothetical protein
MSDILGAMALAKRQAGGGNRRPAGQGCEMSEQSGYITSHSGASAFKNGDAVHIGEGNCRAAFRQNGAVSLGRIRYMITV